MGGDSGPHAYYEYRFPISTSHKPPDLLSQVTEKTDEPSPEDAMSGLMEAEVHGSPLGCAPFELTGLALPHCLGRKVGLVGRTRAQALQMPVYGARIGSLSPQRLSSSIGAQLCELPIVLLHRLCTRRPMA